MIDSIQLAKLTEHIVFPVSSLLQKKVNFCYTS